MTAVIGGALAGLFHRLFISPFIGKQTRKAQSIGTPAAGVMLAFLPFKVAYKAHLYRIISDTDMRREIEHVVDSSYRLAFFFYGLVVVVTILAGIGGKKE